MDKLWTKSEKRKDIEICEEWIKWKVLDYPLNKVITYVESLSVLVSNFLPKPPGRIAYASKSNSILIDDILEMDSISEEEKEQEIRQMIEDDKKELQELAQKVIDQIEIDYEVNLQEYLKSLEGRGFEEETFRRIRGDKEEWE